MHRNTIKSYRDELAPNSESHLMSTSQPRDSGYLLDARDFVTIRRRVIMWECDSNLRSVLAATGGFVHRA